MTFSVCFVASRKGHMLRDYIALANIEDFLPDVENFLRTVQAN